MHLGRDWGVAWLRAWCVLQWPIDGRWTSANWEEANCPVPRTGGCWSPVRGWLAVGWLFPAAVPGVARPQPHPSFRAVQRCLAPMPRVRWWVAHLMSFLTSPTLLACALSSGLRTTERRRSLARRPRARARSSASQRLARRHRSKTAGRSSRIAQLEVALLLFQALKGSTFGEEGFM